MFHLRILPYFILAAAIIRVIDALITVVVLTLASGPVSRLGNFTLVLTASKAVLLLKYDTE